MGSVLTTTRARAPYAGRGWLGFSVVKKVIKIGQASFLFCRRCGVDVPTVKMDCFLEHAAYHEGLYSTWQFSLRMWVVG